MGSWEYFASGAANTLYYVTSLYHFVGPTRIWKYVAYVRNDVAIFGSSCAYNLLILTLIYS